MAGKFKRLAYFFTIYTSMLGDFRRQRQFLKKNIEPKLSDYSQKNDGSLDKEDFHKIMKYYGFGVPAIVGEGFCTLRGKRMTENERIASTGQGVITGLYDDFFDKTGMATTQIREMMENPFTFTPASSLESIFIEYLRTIHKTAHDTDALNNAFERVFNIQVESQLQQNHDVDQESLLRLTLDKGAYSLLFYRSIYQHPMIEGEQDAIYQVGGLMQLANDLFDVYEDSRQGINTIVTNSPKIEALRSIFLNQRKIAFASIKRLEYPGDNKKFFLGKLSLGLSRCLVCLDQLEQLEIMNNNSFDPIRHQRRELICDMEKWVNLFRSFLYYMNTKI